MLSMYRFMCRGHGKGELEPIIRFQQIEFPVSGASAANLEAKRELAAAAQDAAQQEARYGQVVLVDHSGSGQIVAVENLEKRGQPDCLVWLT